MYNPSVRFPRRFQFIVAGCDSAKLLEFIEEPLNKVPFAIERKIGFPSCRSVAFWRDDRGNPALYQPIDQPVRVIRLVSKESIRFDVFQKWFCLGDIGILSRCDAEFHWIAQSVADGMDLCS
ncbi:hypothetical protein S101468_01892 [Acetobacter pasteurianus subsp. pasteurianus]|uniref:Uncharacterized protein n=1 Tax=Acetobacter pasteurianus subsp. pasteurianus TaxID=481145 RepID=A0AAC9X208_ACEPA|nr:hypothetical protein S101468_01892 [Acetobacter pasteurianus subsp. pasteurianus]